MRLFSIALFSFLLLVGKTFAAPEARTISGIPTARESLWRSVSPKFYRTLLISPVKGWIVARGQLAGTRLLGSRVIHSELGGAYDPLALELAGNLRVLGNTGIGTLSGVRNVLVHVLIYDIADGRLAVSFANLDRKSTRL